MLKILIFLCPLFDLNQKLEQIWKNITNSTKIILSYYFQYVTTLLVNAATQPSQVVAKLGKVHRSRNIGN